MERTYLQQLNIALIILALSISIPVLLAQIVNHNVDMLTFVLALFVFADVLMFIINKRYDDKESNASAEEEAC